jgi:hypothetical protein
MNSWTALQKAKATPLRLSFPQQRVWFLSQLEGAEEAYHFQVGFRLKGKLKMLCLNR